MATQILRTVDRWRFEAPLALALAAATGFAALAMPRALFARLPIVGAMGMPGHVALALLLAIVCGIVGYRAMRRPSTIVPVDEDVDQIDEIDIPSGLSEDRLLRLRRADRHPDAPPRPPIRASRDLGEPFMEVGSFAASPTAPAEPVSTEAAIIDGDYHEVEQPAESVAAEPLVGQASIETVVETPPAGMQDSAEAIVEQPVVAAAPVAAAPPAKPTVAPVTAAAPRETMSIAAMTERLAAGMERRAGRSLSPARDMRPALRDALDELNRLAARRG